MKDFSNSSFASFNFMMKSASGLTLMLTGFVLSASGFAANQEQSELVKFALRAQFALFPLVCYAIGTTILYGFSLDEEAHGRIRAELDARSPGS